jgi:hypothetical protein
MMAIQVEPSNVTTSFVAAIYCCGEVVHGPRKLIPMTP